jgi:hypothetical protein
VKNRWTGALFAPFVPGGRTVHQIAIDVELTPPSFHRDWGTRHETMRHLPAWDLRRNDRHALDDGGAASEGAPAKLESASTSPWLSVDTNMAIVVPSRNLSIGDDDRIWRVLALSTFPGIVVA